MKVGLFTYCCMASSTLLVHDKICTKFPPNNCKSAYKLHRNLVKMNTWLYTMAGAHTLSEHTGLTSLAMAPPRASNVSRQNSEVCRMRHTTCAMSGCVYENVCMYVCMHVSNTHHLCNERVCVWACVYVCVYTCVKHTPPVQ
jgi:hypothetical protein